MNDDPKFLLQSTIRTRTPLGKEFVESGARSRRAVLHDNAGGMGSRTGYISTGTGQQSHRPEAGNISGSTSTRHSTQTWNRSQSSYARLEQEYLALHQHMQQLQSAAGNASGPGSPKGILGSFWSRSGENLVAANGQMNAAHKGYIDIDSRVANQQEVIQDLIASKTAMQATIERQDCDMKVLEDSLKRMQEEAFRHTDDARWQPQSATDLEYSLNNIVSRVKQWCEGHVAGDPDPAEEQRHLVKLCEELAKRNLISSPQRVADVLSGRAAHHFAVPRKVSRFLVAAALTADLFSEIIADPFFAFVGKNEEERVLREVDGEAVDHLLTIVSHCAYSPEGRQLQKRADIL